MSNNSTSREQWKTKGRRAIIMNSVENNSDEICYVVGLLFNSCANQVLLIRKDHPKWQAGMLNGIGGKIEDNETPYQAVEREFQEEAGIKIKDWKPFCVLSGESDVQWKVIFFYTCDDEAISQARQLTSEPILILNVDEINSHPTVNNLKWLIEMARSMRNDRAESFIVYEQSSAFNFSPTTYDTNDKLTAIQRDVVEAASSAMGYLAAMDIMTWANLREHATDPVNIDLMGEEYEEYELVDQLKGARRLKQYCEWTIEQTERAQLSNGIKIDKI